VAGQCAYCGADLRPHSMFCLSCGQLVGAAPATTPSVAAPGPGDLTARQLTPYAPGAVPVQQPAQHPVAAPQAPLIAPQQLAPPPPMPPAGAVSSSPPPMPPVSLGSAPGLLPSLDVPPVAPPVAAPVAPPVAAQAAPPVAAPSWSIEHAGVASLVAGLTYVGRNPDAPAGASSRAFPDPGRTMSRTHAAFLPVDGGLMVEDLGSANGTFVERGDALMECQASHRYPLAHGDVVVIGDIRLTVRSGAAG